MRATKEYRLGLTEEAKKIVDDLTLENGIAGNVSRHFKQGETLTLLTMAMLKHAH